MEHKLSKSLKKGPHYLFPLPCCPPHGSLLSLQSSFLSRGQVPVGGHSQLGALHAESLLMSALCFGRADGSRRVSRVRRDQTDGTHKKQ